MTVPLWIKALIVAAMLAALTFAVNRYLNTVEQRGYDRAVLEYQAKLITAQNAATEERNRMQAAVDAAIKGRNDREKSIRAVADAAGVAVGGLRNELDAVRAGVPDATLATLRNTTATLTAVFGDCAERYTGLAEKADRHASDVQASIEAAVGGV